MLLSMDTNEGVLPTMNKNELIGAVAETSGLSRSDATKAVEGVFDTITAALAKGDEVRLVGFGTFRSPSARPRPAATRAPVRR
jgi:nucleoid DNA-binding protein